VNPHFVISTAPNADEPTREEGMRHVREAIAYAKERVDLENTLVYAPNFFSSDGFSERTLGSLSRSPFGEHVFSEADTVDTIDALDKFMKNYIILPVNEHITDGIKAMEALSSMVASSNLLDLKRLKKEKFGVLELSKIAQTVITVRERMLQSERLEGRLDKWSVHKGDSFFDEDPTQVGVSWISAGSLGDVLEGRVSKQFGCDRRMWVTRLEVQAT